MQHDHDPTCSSVAAGELLNVYVISDFAGSTGGAERIAVLEAEGLARRGHRVTLLAGHGEPDRGLIDAGVDVRLTGQPTTLGDPLRVRAAARGIWNREAAALVRDCLASAEPATTVIHLHGLTKVLSASVARAAVRSGLPVIATLHDYFAACPNGGFFNYRTNEICHLIPLSPQCVVTNCDVRAYSHKLWRLARSAVQRSFGEMPGGVRDLIVPSQFAGDVLHPYLPPNARLHILPNPVPEPRMPPVDPSHNAQFAFIGRLGPDKGPRLFAQAARQANVPAVFVGAGAETDAVRRTNPQAKVHGWLNAEGVRTTVRGARAVVSASLWYETQGLSVLEAAAHGVPAIVPDTTVLREAVADGVTGLWFRGGDADDLAEKLLLMANHHHLARDLGANAYERFWSGRWDVGAHLDRVERIYRDALEETGHDRRAGHPASSS